jgi:energy-coupling factor transporter ATP-binding protein EcfA2
MTSQPDLRLSAFLSDRTEVFHSIQHRHDVWRHDPSDVETVHEEARDTFERLLARATMPGRPDSGRIMLLLGDSGCGKTHLLRAFRSLAHERSLGFVGYMQMTTATSNYGRYVLANLIESLDQPYLDPSEPRTGLEKISDGLLVRCDWVAEALKAEEDPDEFLKYVDIAVGVLQGKEEFERFDPDLLRAFLFLQRDDPRIKSRVLRYLRCEDLGDNDRKVLGGMVPRIHDHHPQEMVELLGRIVSTLGHALVLCVDQLEGFNDLESAGGPPFRRAMTTLCDLADRTPSAVIVISCLHNLWPGLRAQLTQPLRDRIESDPKPLKLETLRTADEARRIAERRLEQLFQAEDAPFDPAEPTYPFPHESFEHLAGLRARDVLNACRLWREQAIRDGALPAVFPLNASNEVQAPQELPRHNVVFDQAWNDFRTGHRTAPPDEDAEVAELLAWALRACVDELGPGHQVEAKLDGEAVQVGVAPSGEKLRISLCNRGTQRGALANQIEQARKESRGRIPVVVRTSAFPSSPKAEASIALGKLIGKGGRRAVLEDSDCRALMAMREFRKQHEAHADFAAWLRTAQPLIQLKPLRDILDLDSPKTLPDPTGPGAEKSGQEPVRKPRGDGRDSVPPAHMLDGPRGGAQTTLPFRDNVVTITDRVGERRPVKDAGTSARSTQESDRSGSTTPPRSEATPPHGGGRPSDATSQLGGDGPSGPTPQQGGRGPAERPDTSTKLTSSSGASRERKPIHVGMLDSLKEERVAMQPDELTRHAAFLGGSGSGKTTVALNIIEQLLIQGIPAILIDRKGDLAGYATDAFWTRDLSDPARAAQQARLRECLDIAVFTPGHPQGRPLAIPIVPDGLSQLPDFQRQQATRHAADALAGMLNYRQSPRDKSCRTLLVQAVDLFVQLSPADVTLEKLVRFIGDKDATLVNAAGRMDTKLFDKVADDLDRLRIDAAQLLSSGAEKLDMDLLLGRGAFAKPGKTRLSVVSTRFLGDANDVLFWVSQLLIEVTRWLNKNPSPTLQAVLMFDEADMYLPATRQPATKQPMENLLKRARSAGLGLMLATQSPGDFDYKCRDTIRSWFIGRIKEKNSLEKMRPMLAEARTDFSGRIPSQSTGEFHLVREGRVERLKAAPSALSTEQSADDELLRLADGTRPAR